MDELARITKQLEQAKADLEVALACISRAEMAYLNYENTLRRHQLEQAQIYVDSATKELRIAQHMGWPKQ